MAIPAWARKLGDRLVAFAENLPGLLLAIFILRVAEVRMPLAQTAGGEALFPDALAHDFIALARYMPLLFVLSLPALGIADRKRQMFVLGWFWTALVVLHTLLVLYFATAGVPLGADLFAYSLAEIRITIGGSHGMEWHLFTGLACALAALWICLSVRSNEENWFQLRRRTAAIFMVLCLAVFAAAPLHESGAGSGGTASTVVLNKTTFFIDDVLASVARGSAPVARAGTASGARLVSYQGSDAAHPLVRPEQTPDTLGPLFERFDAPPNLVFIIVEGLGRSFSGPNAHLGSFTPFLDELAARSLYFENFMAPQGRTFGVLPSVFASLPFGQTGFAELPKYPVHVSLPSILKGQGYALRYFTGTNTSFDQENRFLAAEGFDHVMQDKDFPAAYQRSNEWGYADGELVDMALKRWGEYKQPALSVIKTISMHTPYHLRGQERWYPRVEQQLDKLHVPAARRQGYLDQKDIYASILYTDDALRRFFAQAAGLPGFDNTIFLITGDHRLPEIPMDSRIERYHVPLIVFSPKLKAPQRIKAVSSHFDLAPSLLAYMAHNYGVKSPAQVAWLGTGLDVEPEFRNVHAFPIKQTKTELSDFVSGTVYLAQDRLFALGDNLEIEPLNDAAALAKARSQFAAFKAANDLMARSAELEPMSAGLALAAYDDARRTLRSAALAAEHGRLAVTEVKASMEQGELAVDATFLNGAPTASPTFVPLLVLSDANGKQVGEAYGKAFTLDPARNLRAHLALGAAKLPPGTYYAAVIPSHPDTGKAVGIGRYHLEVRR
jgi:uncharacterized sulfatase